MNSHKNARLTIEGRKLLIERAAVMGLRASAEAAGISLSTARKWSRRFEQEGLAGLRDRSSRPGKTRSTVDRPLELWVEQLRRLRMPMRRIAQLVGRSVSTIGRLLARLGLSSLKALDPVRPIVRYEHIAPGEMLHIDIKKLGRIEGIGHRITGDRTGQSNRRAVGRGLAGNTFTSRSMTARVWRSPSCCPANARNMPPPSSTAALPGSAVTALSSNG